MNFLEGLKDFKNEKIKCINFSESVYIYFWIKV